jgi:orotidine-5'-phosphate decarboxylase
MLNVAILAIFYVCKAFFEDLNFDSITVAPYMGKIDSVEPFLAFENKHVMLALTSNEGAFDFRLYPQLQRGAVGQELYKQV